MGSEKTNKKFNNEFQQMVVELESRQRYEAPKIWRHLKKKDFVVSLKRVQRLMR